MISFSEAIASNLLTSLSVSYCTFSSARLISSSEAPSFCSWQSSSLVSFLMLKRS
ncbi:MAG: hypothetical protein H7Y04_09115 [Verrucomicrobia bacterium]|nr:hypothetical protein [Cytophagales bacterium]